MSLRLLLSWELRHLNSLVRSSLTPRYGANTLADTASKGAVLAMTRELAMVHAREGIRFNALCPWVSLTSAFHSTAESID